MARTSSAAVQGVLNEDYDADPLVGSAISLTPFIESATVIVDRIATCAIAKAKTLTAAELELIERWLSAHAYVQSDQNAASRSNMSASVSFQGQTGMYLEGSKYGMMAMMVDNSGCLSAINKRKTARMVWLGKPRSERIPLDQRD